MAPFAYLMVSPWISTTSGKWRFKNWYARPETTILTLCPRATRCSITTFGAGGVPHSFADDPVENSHRDRANRSRYSWLPGL